MSRLAAVATLVHRLCVCLSARPECEMQNYPKPTHSCFFVDCQCPMRAHKPKDEYAIESLVTTSSSDAADGIRAEGRHQHSLTQPSGTLSARCERVVVPRRGPCADACAASRSSVVPPVPPASAARLRLAEWSQYTACHLRFDMCIVLGLALSELGKLQVAARVSATAPLHGVQSCCRQREARGGS